MFVLYFNNVQDLSLGLEPVLTKSVKIPHYNDSYGYVGFFFLYCW